MSRPRLSPAITWPKFERAVLDVFTEGLRRLALKTELPKAEEPMNLSLYWLCREVHMELLNAKKSIPFVIMFDATNQPEYDDAADSRHLKKRPDFGCLLTNEQATDFRLSQISYWLECKRLGAAEANWVLNENYAERGMLRFMRSEHSYAKGCSSASMIGYIQNMDGNDLLTEVNAFAAERTIPSLTKAAAAWADKHVTQLTNQLKRQFDPKPIDMNHLWIDLRHCKFTRPSPKPTATKTEKNSKKSTAKKKSA